MIRDVKQEKIDITIQKAVSVLLSFAFFITILFVPLLLMNREKGKMSSIENRYLASFPQLSTPEGINRSFPSQFKQWFSDNLGLRDTFATINADVKVKMFSQSSGTVNIGREGYYFYTGDNNVELAFGTYSLTEEHLAELAARQQRIADGYALRGIDYFYIINPSKATIYPEYVYDPSGKTHGVAYSPAQEAADYLTQHTMVKAMTPKEALLAAKREGKQVFLKTDSHYTQLGAYIAACAVGDFMGIPMPAMTGTHEEHRKGEFSSMFGNPNLLPAESAPVPDVEGAYTYIDQNSAEQHGDFYIRLKELAAAFTPSGFSVYENPDAPGGTLLVYGDSQVGAGLGHYFYRHYSRVILLHMTSFTSGNPEIEALVKPNAVLRDIVERYTGSEVNLQPNAAGIVDAQAIAQYPAVGEQMEAYYRDHHEGLYIDQPANDGVTLTVSTETGVLYVEGWLLDPYARRELSALYIKGKNNRLIDVWDKYNEHTGPRTFYEDPLLPTDIGFRATVPLDALENPNELVFVRIGAYGERLPDKIYILIDSEVNTNE